MTASDQSITDRLRCAACSKTVTRKFYIVRNGRRFSYRVSAAARLDSMAKERGWRVRNGRRVCVACVGAGRRAKPERSVRTAPVKFAPPCFAPTHLALEKELAALKLENARLRAQLKRPAARRPNV